MNRFTFIAFWITVITLAGMVHGATLVSLVDARTTGGTSVGSFRDNELPSFLLAPSSGRFSISNSGPNTVGTWEFAVFASGATKLQSSNTLNLNSITSFSSATTIIDPNAIPVSADRFNPSAVWYLIARVGQNYEAFQVALWMSSPTAPRLRFYGTTPVTLEISTGALTVIPEPGKILLLPAGIVALILRRRRISVVRPPALQDVMAWRLRNMR